MKPSKNKTLTKLYKEQAGICAYCGNQMLLGLDNSNHDKHISLDHIIPSSKGGLTTRFNLVACCRKCNSSKGNKPLIVYLSRITNGEPQKHPMYNHPANFSYIN